MLSPDLDIGRRWLAGNPPPGRMLVCGVSGAHLYGFPSPDSDLDLKGIHLAPTRQLLGLAPRTPAHDAVGVLDGVECDLTTNEAGNAMMLLLNGNGNMLERILSPWQLADSAELADLQTLARGAVSRRFARHYGGFFRGRCAAHEREPTTKSLAYTWRVALTGIHLLRTGELVCDLAQLSDLYHRPVLHDLIEAKAAGGEHGSPPSDLDDLLRRQWPELDAALIDAEKTSPLPAEAPNRSAVEAWLLEARLGDLAATTCEPTKRDS